jgi:hypothetical protein
MFRWYAFNCFYKNSICIPSIKNCTKIFYLAHGGNMPFFHVRCDSAHPCPREKQMACLLSSIILVFQRPQHDRICVNPRCVFLRTRLSLRPVLAYIQMTYWCWERHLCTKCKMCWTERNPVTPLCVFG